MKPTPYRDINGILNLLRTNLICILGDNLVSLYLVGSLTYGDFDKGSSDIDLLIIIRNPLSAEKLQEIKSLHADIGEKYPEWRKRIEASYVVKSMLSDINPPKEPRPYFNADRMYILNYGYEWVMQLYATYTYGITLYGPKLKDLIEPIAIENVKEASKKILRKEWEPKLKEQAPFDEDDYDHSHLQAYAILTMCRALYTAKNKDFVSKKVASTWAKKTYGEPWRSLIEKAENWEHGKELHVEKEALEFIKFTIDQAAI